MPISASGDFCSLPDWGVMTLVEVTARQRIAGEKNGYVLLNSRAEQHD
jgi:hypothetical protein